MSKISVMAYSDPDTNEPKAYVVRLDEQGKLSEALQSDGTWRPVSIYTRTGPDDGFRLSNATVNKSQQEKSA
jgi:hypothetical protein